jgi:hypothetical protein
MVLRTAGIADPVSALVRIRKVGLLAGSGACMVATKYRG